MSKIPQGLSSDGWNVAVINVSRLARVVRRFQRCVGPITSFGPSRLQPAKEAAVG